MITYVNTLFVANNTDKIGVVTKAADITTANAGKFAIITNENGMVKIGQITNKTADVHKKDGTTKVPVVRWTNEINPKDIKSFNELTYTDNVAEKVDITFGMTGNDSALLAQGGKRIVVRIQYKDLPTRYRKWSETYEYVTKEGDTNETIAKGIANSINYQYKRARVTATAEGGKVTLTAMEYTDNDTVDSISWDETVRFTVNVFYTDPQATGFGANIKHFPAGLKIEKTPGKKYAADAKLVRDREAKSFGYMGILNRGECTWPIIKPNMETKLDAHYDGLTIEFENHYRTADDWIKTTKQSVEIYGTTGQMTDLIKAIKIALGMEAATTDGE